MSLDAQIEDGIERAVAHELGVAEGPGDQQLRARRLVWVAVRACAKICGPWVAAAEAFTVGRKVAETRVKP